MSKDSDFLAFAMRLGLPSPILDRAPTVGLYSVAVGKLEILRGWSTISCLLFLDRLKFNFI